MSIRTATFHTDELECVDTSRMVVLASGGPLMVVENIRTAGEFGCNPDKPTEALCSWFTEDGETEERWFDVRALRMLSPFDLERFASWVAHKEEEEDANGG